jgi:hypothetical protein
MRSVARRVGGDDGNSSRPLVNCRGFSIAATMAVAASGTNAFNIDRSQTPFVLLASARDPQNPTGEISHQNRDAHPCAQE